jgi:hypothetical protein
MYKLSIVPKEALQSTNNAIFRVVDKSDFFFETWLISLSHACKYFYQLTVQDLTPGLENHSGLAHGPAGAAEKTRAGLK